MDATLVVPEQVVRRYMGRQIEPTLFTCSRVRAAFADNTILVEVLGDQDVVE